MDVKTLCLGVLSRKECSGYEIRKEFEEGGFGHFQEAGFGSIYPALKKLTEEGLVVATEHQQDSRPDKKVYRITPQGRQALFEAVNREPGPDSFRSDFLFTLFFADLLPPRQVDRLVANRIAYHREVVREMEAGTEAAELSPGEAFVMKFGLAMHKAACDFLEEHQHEVLGRLLQRQVAE
jgi:PadR family transcriptional regulator, regulatory protein AphA